MGHLHVAVTAWADSPAGGEIQELGHSAATISTPPGYDMGMFDDVVHALAEELLDLVYA